MSDAMLFYSLVFSFVVIVFLFFMALILLKLAVIIAPVAAAGFIIWLIVRLVRRKP